MKNRLARLTILTLAIAGIGLVGAAGPAAASVTDADTATEICYVTVHPHVMPGVIWDPNNGIGVETGEYHIHQNCVEPGTGA